MISTLPDLASSSIEEIAAFYSANLAELTALDGWLFRVKRRLREAIEDRGPMVTPSGRVFLRAGSEFEYPPEIAQEFPGLGRHVVTATVDTVEQAEQILELVTEQVPSADVGHEMKVDGKRAAAQIAKGGEAAHRLLDLRIAKSKLAVGP